MFTGIIQGTGEVLSLQKRQRERRLRIRPRFAMTEVRNGESIAVNGACLSVEQASGESFTAYASEETLSRTTLGQLRQGSLVNLERALSLGDRLGGHLVTGHVDCLAILVSMRAAGESERCRLTFPAEFAPEVVSKGSVALDGISLTVNICGADFLEVNVIPDTQRHTNMSLWRPGRQVNMETDLIGKYVRQMLQAGKAPVKSLGWEQLARNGYL